MQGSKASNLLEEKCTSGGWSATLGDTVDASLKKAYLDAQTARKRANKLMCGIKSSGLASTDGAALALVGSMAFKDGSLHDGVVDFNSCSVGFGNFVTDAEAGGNYKASVNHLDTSFRNGDGWWGADRKPVKWFECAL
ncbi:hypothetical protein SPRG_16703 [Saprolegnia parasitica CBS 223.65]|uniref:Uncharacterized protein n=1 Tax=Saprolegnia parasitica (strain CBS 223.65) TaxID=695850 RepID=A0A067BU21_SAPPC|nr:hypothetical protein SPRG_16703 [Saprolegnia parasitica CBS 223.65]KDO17776.1 hypothetical protein SPRG_16703 [Saprolegnia parasitica CBS 223.65]|eukprot:XP_012211513.1 hypothetical protein SPRG_16703 [Saprolegnia parasitica CBS 223.65]